MECCGKAMLCFHMKSARFHEIRRILKDQLPGMVSPMFFYFEKWWNKNSHLDLQLQLFQLLTFDTA